VESSNEIGAAGLWDWFRTSTLWRMLRRVGFLRRGLYVAIELRRSWREPKACARDQVDHDLEQRRDPWSYETNPIEQERFRQQTSMIDAARNGNPFRRGLEIGCAEGLYTAVLAQRCDSLLVLDLSPTALARASRRQPWPEGVRLNSFDLRTEAIPGKFDLIVVAGVLEYFSRPSTMARVREKLVAALEPEGCLLVETSRPNPVVEDSWWGRLLIRGKWINTFVAQHPSLLIAAQTIDDNFAITLYRKSGVTGETC
jgi:SAM-dependent methyltransferase